MWIRSQDKKTLVKADKLIIGYDTDEKVYEIHNVYDSLGTYKSKERALEVLDDIENKIMMNKVIEIFSNLGDMAQANRENYTYTPIYQIPSK